MKELSILLLSVFMLSTAPAWVKSIDLPPLHGLTARLLLATFALGALSYKNLLRSITIKNLIPISGVGLVLCLHFWSWFAGLQEVTIGLCATLFAMNPIFSAILGAVILKENFKPRFFISIALAIAGIFYSTIGASYFRGAGIEESYSSRGVILIVSSSFLYALYMVLSKLMRRGLPNGPYTCLLNGTAFMWAFFALLISGASQGFGEIFGIYSTDLTPTTVFAIVGVVIGPSMMGHALMIYSLPHFNINFVGIFKLLSPISASFLGILIYGEKFETKLLIALALVLSGVLVALPWERGIKKNI